MNEHSTQEPDRNFPTENQANNSIAGVYLMNAEDIPTELKEYAINKLNPSENNYIVPAKEGGSYYGPVILNNENFIVQAVGREKNCAVVHQKDKIELKGSTSSLDEKKQLNGFNIQVHYTGDKAKAYPYKPKEKNADQEQEKPEQQQKKRTADSITVEKIISTAQEYASKNIKNGNQRAAFLKHLEGVTLQLQQKELPSQSKSMENSATPQKDTPSKQADIER
ncbi:MAG: hypothetical protein PHI97_33645 [Desulfobulbus sp.]|nr:hypothetical protein [Desulfobulbus sp.]